MKISSVVNWNRNFYTRKYEKKIPELNEVLYCENYDIIFVTETWLRVVINSGSLTHMQVIIF